MNNRPKQQLLVTMKTSMIEVNSMGTKLSNYTKTEAANPEKQTKTNLLLMGLQ